MSEATMEKALVMLVVMTLMEEVTSCESPILNAVVIGGAVLLMVRLWSGFTPDASDTDHAGSGLSTVGEGARYRSPRME